MSEEIKDENVFLPIINAIKKAEPFGPFSTKTPSKGDCYLHWQKTNYCDIDFHYEIIVGGVAAGDKEKNKDKIYAEFHMEPRSKASSEIINEFKESITNAVKELENIEILGWYNSRGFAIRCKDGGITVAQLAAQMTELHTKIDNIISQFFIKYTFKKMFKNSDTIDAIDFLTAVNKSLLCLKEKEPKHASSNLIGILEEIFEGTEYKMTFSQNIARDDLGVELAKNEPIKICKYIEKVKEKKYIISPFTFWSIFFAYANNSHPKPTQRNEMFKALVNWYDPNLNSEDIAGNLMKFRKTKIGEARDDKGLKSNTLTIEGWLQLVENLSAFASTCWQLFKELMQDNPDKNKINELLQKNKDESGLFDCKKIGKEAVPNILYFIRPDLQFDFDKNGNVTNIIRSKEMEIKNTIELLENSKQIILTGAPGTGKTYHATEVAEKMVEEAGGGEYKKVQFHPGYDYSDFIIGLKPEVKGGQVTFEWNDGVFKEFADKALEAYKQAEKIAKEQKEQAEKTKDEEIKAKPYIFIIDEINRADLSRVFGEVFSLLEEDYRYPNKEKGITLPSKDNFILPPNLYIIGTMNDIDRSVESMDFALRRRFSWKEVTANDSERIIDATKKNGENEVYKIESEKYRSVLKQAMAELNKYIGGEELEIDKQKVSLNLGTEYQLGGAYFLNFAKYPEGNTSFESLWNNHIAIILNEYLRGRSNREQILSALKAVYDDAWQGKSNGKNTSAAGDDSAAAPLPNTSETPSAEENK